MPRALYLNLFQSMPHANHFNSSKPFYYTNICVTNNGDTLSLSIDIYIHSIETIDFSMNLQLNNSIRNRNRLVQTRNFQNLIIWKRKFKQRFINSNKSFCRRIFFVSFEKQFDLNKVNCLGLFCGEILVRGFVCSYGNGLNWTALLHWNWGMSLKCAADK